MKCARPVIVAAVAGLAVAGCATPGPLHVYTVDPAAPAAVRDTGPAPAADVPSFLAPGETLTGFAYDPFTDHFFLRLAPGDRIRVIDRPARAIKREFTVAALRAAGGGDLAIRPRDGHVFALVPAGSVAVEFTRYGGFVRRITLDALPGRAAGLACDAANDRLFVLCGGSPARVTTHSPEGKLLSTVALDREIAPGSLGYDADKKEFYAPLATGEGIGVFGEDGKARGVIAVHATFVDVGPRSFLRMF